MKLYYDKISIEKRHGVYRITFWHGDLELYWNELPTPQWDVGDSLTIRDLDGFLKLTPEL